MHSGPVTHRPVSPPGGHSVHRRIYPPPENVLNSILPFQLKPGHASGCTYMTRFKALGIAFLVLLAAPAPALEAGAAKSRLTVPQGTPLGGYAERLGRESLGEHDGLWSRCLYLDDTRTQVYIVSVDLPHIPRALRDRVVDLAAAFAPKENIFLSATSTHNGPGGMDQSLAIRWTSGRYNPETLEIVAQAVVATMESARDQKRRATLGQASVKQQALSSNRFISDGPIDEQIGVIRVDDADGKAISVLTSFSARPDIAPENARYLLSADFPGAYYRFMEEQTTPDCVAIFLPGASADQSPGNPESLEGWDRVDSIGRLLAIRAKEAANGMTFRDVTIKTAYTEAPLPRSLAEGGLPATAIFQLLDLDNLQLAFLPGEPSVEIGLALRRDGLASGKSAQFTVGMANEYVGTFVAPPRFGDPRYLPAATPFGPDAESWIRKTVDSMSRGAETAEDVAYPAAKVQELPGSIAMTLRGPGYQRGYQRGVRAHDALQARFKDVILVPVQAGTLRPNGDAWGLWPSLLDPAPLALPILGRESRPMLQGLGNDLLAEAEGFAAGADLPLDGALLLQQAPRPVAATEESAPAILSGTQFIVAGERAGSAAVIAGCNLDWPEAPEAPQVISVEPDEGHNFICLGFDWQLGALTGMNDAGVVLCLARNSNLGEAPLGGASAALTIRQELQFSADYDEVVARLRASTQLRGHQVLVVAPSKKGWRGAVLSFGKSVGVREVEKGVLLGLDPESGSGDGAAQERYAAAAARIGTEDLPVGLAEVQQVLATGAAGDGAPNLPWNSATRHSVVFTPANLTLQVAFPNEQGVPGAYTEFRIKKATRHE